MKLLMISGDRSVLQGKRGAFWYTLEELRKHWDRIDVICPQVVTMHDTQIFENVHFHPSPRALWYQPRWIAKKGAELIAAHHHDAMTVHAFPPFYTSIGARTLARKTGVPRVLEVHHIVGYPKPASPAEAIGYRMSRLYFPHAIASAEATRVVNAGTKDVLVSLGAPVEKISVVPSFYLDASVLQADAEPVEKKYDVVFCARLVANKGLPALLRAVNILPGVTLLVIGGVLKQWLSQDEKRIIDRALEIEDRVTIVGWQPEHKDVVRLIRAGKIFVMNSTSEGGPRVALEAMACGMPVISTRVGVMPDVIRDGQNGLFTTGDPDDLAQKIKHLLDDPALCERMGREATKITERFERVHLIREYANFLKNVGKKTQNSDTTEKEGGSPRLLIVTQAVDRQDPVLGFFHGWLREFALRSDGLEVIAQRKGDTDLPPSVTVHSLGKEAGHSTGRQVLRFWWRAWTLRDRYDTVLVHMTPVWMVLGAPLWILLRKKRFLWYEARGGGWMLTFSLLVIRKVFSASSKGMPMPTVKSVVVGHGIDTERFCPAGARGSDVLTVGRVTRAKRLDLLLRCFAALPDRDAGARRFQIVGGPITQADRAYLQLAETEAASLGIADRVTIRPLPQDQVLPLLQRAALFVHASETALDKALLEAMACGCPVLSCAEVASELLPPECIATPETMAGRAAMLLMLTEDEKRALGERLRAVVVKDHGLERLIGRLLEEMDTRPSERN